MMPLWEQHVLMVMMISYYVCAILFVFSLTMAGYSLYQCKVWGRRGDALGRATLYQQRQKAHDQSIQYGINFFHHLRWVVVLYLACGLLMGISFKMITPAMTWAGTAYITAIWPAWQTQDLTGLHPPVPAWSFDFSPWDK